MKIVVGLVGLVSYFILWGGCLFKENYNVYLKFWVVVFRGRVISESWVIN